MKSHRNLVIFDLDGTLTKRDTYIPFLLSFYRRRPVSPFRIAALGLSVLRFMRKRIDNTALKQHFLSAFAAGAERRTIESHAMWFVERLIARGLRADALQVLQSHLGNGDIVILLSASFDFYVPRIGERLGFTETLCTAADWRNDRLSGQLGGPNCHGLHKVEHLKSLKKRYPEYNIVAYADDKSDIPLLLLADQGYLIGRSPTAIAEAKRSGLTILDWD